MQTQNKLITIVVVLLAFVGLKESSAQQKTDSLIINVGKSKIIFLVNEIEDLKSMQQYDLNQVLDHLSVKLMGDSTLVRENGTEVDDTTVVVNERRDNVTTKTERSEEPKDIKFKLGTHHSFNFDIGMNNYLQDGDFPGAANELYTVKPFGSWYVGISSIYKSYISKPFYIEWGGGVSWYNFKFENTRTRLVDGDDEVMFMESQQADIGFKKSKLTVAYVHASFVPMLDFGKPTKYSKNFWRSWTNNYDKRGFRIGLGGYVGYKIDSYTKTVVDDGGKEKDRFHDDYHLESFRYGARLQLGYRGTDLFFNYDLNELFIEDGGPKLNAFSFGIIL